jgi:hypothetical protein
MKKMQVFLILISSFLSINIFASEKNSMKPIYVCNVKGMYKRIVNETTSYFVTENFEVVCDDKKVEVKDRLGEKWLVWLSASNFENTNHQILNLSQLKAENHYKVVSQIGESEVGLSVGNKMAIDCHIKL